MLTGEHTQTVSGMRISCDNLLHSNARRQLASALLYQAKRWRWEPEGKHSTLGAPYSLASLIPWSSLNVCSIHQTYSTIVFPAQLFCSDSDNTEFLMNIWDPQQRIAEEYYIVPTKQKRMKWQKTWGHPDCRTQDRETLFSMPKNEEKRLPWTSTTLRTAL